MAAHAHGRSANDHSYDVKQGSSRMNREWYVACGVSSAALQRLLTPLAHMELGPSLMGTGMLSELGQ